MTSPRASTAASWDFAAATLIRCMRMGAYMANGASLGWLLLPQGRTVEVWTAA
jgi:hypothetical protein